MGVNLDTRGYAKVKAAARYAGVSERTFRGWLKEGLRHIRLRSGTILVPFSAIDEYLSRYEVSGEELDEIVNETLKGLLSENKA